MDAPKRDHHRRFPVRHPATPGIGTRHANHVPSERRLFRHYLYVRAGKQPGFQMRLTPLFSFLSWNLAASGTGQASVWIHQTSRRYSQAPFKNVKGAVQRVAFHPLKPHFFVAVNHPLFFLRCHHTFPLETAETATRGILTHALI